MHGNKVINCNLDTMVATPVSILTFDQTQYGRDGEKTVWGLGTRLTNKDPCFKNYSGKLENNQDVRKN